MEQLRLISDDREMAIRIVALESEMELLKGRLAIVERRLLLALQREATTLERPRPGLQRIGHRE